MNKPYYCLVLQIGREDIEQRLNYLLHNLQLNFSDIIINFIITQGVFIVQFVTVSSHIGERLEACPMSKK